MSSQVAYPDFSGITQITDNPYDALLELCHNDPALIQERYSTHREKRNEQQKIRMLGPDFEHLDLDLILHKLVHQPEFPDYKDTRNCLVFWARPTQAVKELIESVQKELREIAPTFWMMPPENLHMTALEIAHSHTAEEIDALVEQLRPKLQDITDYTYNHRTCLVQPMVSYDASAIALSFVPLANDAYTYHHLRRDLYGLCKSTGVTVSSRYVVPSAHLTIGRFVGYDDLGNARKDAVAPEKVKSWIAKLEEINDRLRREYWSRDSAVSEFKWMVGQEKGLDFNKGTLWYGDGVRVRLGKGF